MAKYAVLGLGLMGSALCFDLLTNDPSAQVFGFDRDHKQCETRDEQFNSFNNRFHSFPLSLDLKDNIETHGLKKALAENDVSVVFGAVDYKYNYWLSKLCIQAGTSFVDLGGNPSVIQQQRTLDNEAQDAQVTIIPDLGLAPGMINIIAAHGMRKFDKLDECHLRVGGLPQEPSTILSYQQVFAIRGLTNEYLEDAIIIRDGKKMTVPSLTELESLSFPEPWGELEAFQTAGGSSSLPEIFKKQIRELTYKTIRFPGHAQFFKFLKDFGLLSSSPHPKFPSITPREVIEFYLEKNLPRGQPDAVLAQIAITGKINSQNIKHTYQMIDLMDPTTGYSAMARTTSFPSSIIGQFIANHTVSTHGVVYAEEAVPATKLLEELKKREITFDFSEVLVKR